MTSYDGENGGPDFSPIFFGVQLHDLRLMESARLPSHSPQYWVHHMGREKTLSAALQLQHDAGLILSNVQVLQQLVTALNRASSDVMRAVHGRQPFPTNAMQQVMPSYRQSSPGGPLHDGDGFVAATSRAGNTWTSAVGDVQCLYVLQ